MTQNTQPYTPITFPGLFEQQVERTPDAPALVAPERAWTYTQLNQAANRLARQLVAAGVTPGALVALYLDKSPRMVIALLAAMKAGAAYVPIDPTYPADRKHFMLTDSGAHLVVTEKKHHAAIAEAGVSALLWEEVADRTSDDTNLGLDIPLDSLAYVIYTSGSTGKPKGVALEHKGIGNLALNQKTVLGIAPGSRILLFASFSFDASVYEMIQAFHCGGSLHLGSKDALLPGPSLGRFLTERQIQAVTLPPTALALLPPGDYPHLSHLMVAGEACPPELAARWSVGRRFFNLYGPTETTVWASAAELFPGCTQAPIGRAIWNTSLVVLDEQLQPIGQEIPGELYIGGDGLARGYLNRPELTAERFIENPFGEGRLYKTGDLVQWLPDGNLAFLGRIDHQVKLRGFRIELGEIETALREQEGVREALVVAHGEHADEKQLVAYVVADTEQLAQADQSQNTEQVEQWQQVFEHSYGQGEPVTASDPTFDITGWGDSYTGGMIPDQQMREWVENTCDAIRATRPQRVLEIGCGTGLLLFRIAPHCQSYYGIDASRTVVEQTRAAARGLPHVQVHHQTAHELDYLPDNSFDTVIINSVAQYFPRLEYLTQVITSAVRMLQPGGRLFLGDIRNYALQDVFATAIEVGQASPEATVGAVRTAIQRRLTQEEELLVAPDYFYSLPQQLPEIENVTVQLKRGQFHNELTRHRFDVVLWLKGEQPAPAVPAVTRHAPAAPETLQTILAESRPECLLVPGIANARLAQEIALHQALQACATPELPLARLPHTAGAALDPETLHALTEGLPYRLQLWLGGDQPGTFTACWVRDDIPLESAYALTEKPRSLPGRAALANNPLWSKQVARLVPQLRSALEARLPEYMLPSAYVVLEAFPLSPNGKIDRKALPAPEFRGAAEDYLAPRTELEATIARIWQDVLVVDKIGIHDNFYHLGGHSLLATRIIVRLQDVLGHEVPVRFLLESPTVAALAERITHDTSGALATVPLVPVPREEVLPLSFAQQRIWLVEQLEVGTAGYTAPGAVHLQGPVEPRVLEQAIQHLVARHETLRTSFVTRGDHPAQQIAAHCTLPLEFLSLEDVPEAELWRRVREKAVAEAHQPFDLTLAPLIRLVLVRLAPEEHVLLVTMHHIISDLWSIGIFLKELGQLYGDLVVGQEPTLPPLPIQYADYAIWQRQWLEGERLEQLSRYWQQQLAGAPPTVSLPTDRPRLPYLTYDGNQQEHSVSVATSQALSQWSRQSGVTLYMTLMAAFNVLMGFHANQTDLVLGTNSAGRNQQELEGLIGFFINQLAIRTKLAGSTPFDALVRQVRETTLQAFAHQEMPYDKLVERIKQERELNRTAIFQVLFVQNTPVETMTYGALTIRPLRFNYETSRFDLAVFAEEQDSGIMSSWVYNTNLFKQETIARYAEQFKFLLESVAQNPNITIEALNAQLARLEKEAQAAERQDREQSSRKLFERVRPKPVQS